MRGGGSFVFVKFHFPIKSDSGLISSHEQKGVESPAQEQKSVFLNPTCRPASFLPWAKINSRTYFKPVRDYKPRALEHRSCRQDYINRADQIRSETLEDVNINHKLFGNEGFYASPLWSNSSPVWPPVAAQPRQQKRPNTKNRFKGSSSHLFQSSPSFKKVPKLLVFALLAETETCCCKISKLFTQAANKEKTRLTSKIEKCLFQENKML